MRTGIISDVHGNLGALLEVLADIEARGVSQIYCLGDVVGYGPDPVACLELVMERCKVRVMGNHDLATDCGLARHGMNETAAEAMGWTISQLTEEHIAALQGFALRHEQPGATFVHGSPDKEAPFGYMSPKLLEIEGGQWLMQAAWDSFDGLCFCGHSHVPGVFHRRQNGTFEFCSPGELADDPFATCGHKYIVNVGSVGQPRDGDRRACYAIYEDGKDGDEPAIEFRRVPYSVETTACKIIGKGVLADPLAAKKLAERLVHGR